jgi:calcineurin-like phosphoesterase family protein
MPGCCHLTRRELLRWSALVAASPLLGALDDPARAYAAGRVPVPMNLELVTLTETSAVLTWYTGDPSAPDGIGRPSPVPADSEVLLGTSPTKLRVVHHSTAHTPYHYVELRGLEPGQTYFYVARSRGLPAAPAAFFAGNPVGTSTLDASASGPFVFTTPHPPPGTFLFAIALCNDLHLGETVSGLAKSVGGAGVPPGFRQVPGEPPYTQVMAEALGPEATARGAHVLLVNGDVSSDAAREDVRAARHHLDGFGDYRHDYFVTRGNHDRPHNNTKAAACTSVDGHDGYHDCFRDSFFPDGAPTWFRTEVHGLRLIGLDTYDKIGSGSDNGVLSAEQMSFLRHELAQDRDRPTLVVGHHPVTAESTVTSVPPISFDLNRTQGAEIERLYAATPGVFLHHCAHTHRNRRTRSPVASRVVFQEVAAVKEYPGGFHLLRVFSGGYALNFYKFRSALAKEWSERTRQEYFGLYPYYVAGTMSDRNHVVVRDLSGLAAPGGSPHEIHVPGDSERASDGQLATTGSDRTMPAAGAVAVAAGAAAEAWLRRRPSTTS